MSHIQAYHTVLSQNPQLWNLYPIIADLYPTPLEKSHILLQGAWEALRHQEYKTSQDLATKAHQADPSRFSFYLIDLELLRTQKKSHLIPPKLQEIGRLFEQKALPAQAVKAYKRHAQLSPSQESYQKVIALYAQIGKQDKATRWVEALAKLKPASVSKEPPESKKTAQPQKSLFSRPFSKEPPESKEAPAHSSQSSRSSVPALAFGRAAWEEYIGSVGAEPPLPPDINEILQSPCPFWPNKKVQETHLLVLIPETVNGNPLTLKSLGELVQKPLKGNPTQYGNFYLGQYQDPPAPKSHWALLTTDVIPGSRSKSYKDQQALIETHNQKSRLPYQVPNVLDVAVCLFMHHIRMHHIRTGDHLYPHSLRTWARCQEKYDKNYQLVVGGAASEGFDVLSAGWVYAPHGVRGLRKFPR